MTGDSYIVHVVPVTGSAGAAAYLAKYISKTLYDHFYMEDAGFTRRWSTSRKWPGNGRIRLAQSLAVGGKGWEKVDFMAGANYPERGDIAALARVGPEIIREISAKRKAKGNVSKLKGMLNATNVRT